MKKIRGYKDVNVRWKNLILISFHCCVRIRPEYIMLPFWGNRKTSEYRVVCFTEKQRNSLRGGSLLAFPLYTLSDRYSSFFFSFSNCRDRCSTMRARFRVATSSFCFPHEFPHSTPSISDGSLKKSSYNYWFKGEKYGRNENENFSYRNLSILIQLPFSKQHQYSHHCRYLIWRCNNANFRYSRKSKKKKKRKAVQRSSQQFTIPIFRIFVEKLHESSSSFLRTRTWKRRKKKEKKEKGTEEERSRVYVVKVKVVDPRRHRGYKIGHVSI